MELERIVAQFLAGEDPILLALRRQHAQASITQRERVRNGMIVSYLIPSRVPRVAAIAYLVLGDIVVQLHEIKSVVYPTLTIDAGRISSLEMYAMHEAWPARATIKDISYCAWAAGSQGERVLIPYRDVGALARALHPGAE